MLTMKERFAIILRALYFIKVDFSSFLQVFQESCLSNFPKTGIRVSRQERRNLNEAVHTEKRPSLISQFTYSSKCIYARMDIAVRYTTTHTCLMTTTREYRIILSLYTGVLI